MIITKKQITWTVIATLAFYVAGRLLYEPFYRLTLSLITTFSGGNIKFFGKFPFWFIGDPLFGLVSAAIPISFLLDFLILPRNMKLNIRATVLLYAIFLTVFYLAVCYYESFYLVARNDFYNGQPIMENLREVDLNIVLLCSIILTTIVIGVINSVKRLTAKRLPTT